MKYFLLSLLASASAEDLFCDGEKWKPYANIIESISGLTDESQIANLGLAVKAQFPELTKCRIVSGIVELSNFVLSLILSNGRLSISEVEGNLAETMRIFASKSLFSELFFSENRLSISFFTILRTVSSVLQRTVAGDPHFASTCAVSFRYKSSSISSIHSQYPEWSSPTSVLPIASRIRDLSITRIKCVEESLVSVISITRTIRAVGGSSNFPHLISLIQSMAQQVGIPKLLGSNVPVISALSSLVFPQPSNADLRYIGPISGNRRNQSIAPLFGFDCSENAKKQETCESEKNSFTKECEVARVVGKLGCYSPSPTLNRDLREEFTFLQSINANWYSNLNNGWGELLTRNLNTLAEKIDISTTRTICQDKYLQEIDLSESSDYLIANGLEKLMSVSPHCSVLISASMALVHLGLIRLIHEAQLSPGIQESLVLNDIASILEMEWQTVAGDKLDALLTDKHGLFKIMNAAWRVN